MKSKILILLFVCVPFNIFPLAKEGEDLQIVENLITTQERQLTVYKELHSLMTEFQTKQTLFSKGPQTKELASQMIETASKILKIAEDHQLLHLLTPFYVEELKFFTEIMKKRAHEDNSAP